MAEKYFTNIPIVATEEYIGYGNREALSGMDRATLLKELERANKEIQIAKEEYAQTIKDGLSTYVPKERIADAEWYRNEVKRRLDNLSTNESVEVTEKSFDDMLAKYDALEKQYRLEYKDKDNLEKALSSLERGRAAVAKEKEEAKTKYNVTNYDEYRKIKDHEKWLRDNNMTENQFKRQEFVKNMYGKVKNRIKQPKVIPVNN